MSLIYLVKTVMSIIILENFFYKYYIGVNFVALLNKEEISKEKLVKDFFFLLSLAFGILYFIKKIYHFYITSEIGYIILIILSTYFSLYIYEKMFKFLYKRIYFSTNIFLMLIIIENKFPDLKSKIVAILIIPLFYYLNLAILIPLIKTLDYKIRSKYVKKEALIIIVIALIGLIINAFEGL